MKINTDYYRHAANTAAQSISDKYGNVNFSETLSGASANAGAKIYLEHLRSKYGSVAIKNVGKDQKELEKLGKSMSGSDVVIAPDMFEKMAENPETAAYYEGIIDDFFADEPAQQKKFAAMGLTYEVCGAVVHEDGTVTLICGGGDSPERVAEVNRINRERDEQRAEARKLFIEKAGENALLRKLMRDKAASQNEIESRETAWRPSDSIFLRFKNI